MHAAPSQVEWFHPGEIVVVSRVARDDAADESQLSARVHAAVHPHLDQHVRRDSSATRAYVFDAPGEPKSLVFSIHELMETATHRPVKDAVDTLHQRLGDLQGAGVEVMTAMPHVHVRANEESSGASPGSYPRPVYPDQVPSGPHERSYRPVNPRLDLAAAAQDTEPIPVAILDSLPDLAAARTHAMHMQNRPLLELVRLLEASGQTDPRYASERLHLDRHHRGATVEAGSEPRPYRMQDHGLFVAGLIHGLAPRAGLDLEPVLDEFGAGDLSQLLIGLQRVLASKAPNDPRIVNLSLGFMPHPARLPAAWYGLARPNDPAYKQTDEMFDARHDLRWVASNRTHIARTVDLLETGLRELARYLSLNNCLVLAAAGNDSLREVETRQARMGPRLPARFETVLGVAATTSDPLHPARYSNLGDERELGDHVATFGGNSSHAFEPDDGVVGLYAGAFPDGRPNETGWAYWSGTSFATAIMSGIAANFWAVKRKQEPALDAAGVLADLHAEVSAGGLYVPDLRTPSIEIRSEWRASLE